MHEANKKGGGYWLNGYGLSLKSVFKKNNSQLSFFAANSGFFTKYSAQKAYPNRVRLFRMRALALSLIRSAH